MSTHNALGWARGTGDGWEISGSLAAVLQLCRATERDGIGSSRSCDCRTLCLNYSGL